MGSHEVKTHVTETRARAWILVRFVVLSVQIAGCGSEEPIVLAPDKEVCLTRRDGESYCIETYEASRKDATSDGPGLDSASLPRSLGGARPWVDIAWDAARGACASKGRRLCERDEWIDACDGQPGEDVGFTFTYGDTLDATRCNTGGSAAQATGARPECLSSAGTFDQSGNVWEWTGNSEGQAATRGGSFRSSNTHECKSGDALRFIATRDTSPEVGFRCCRSP